MTIDDAPEVRVRGGAVRGRRVQGTTVFAGIPFAEPESRFGRPEPVDEWSGVLDAATFGPPPPQSGLLGSIAEVRTDDGWLTANVWSPDLTGDLPVMVWIHGGGYVFGTSGLPEYDGARLATDGNVVVVTFNHRVGLEGFGLIAGAPVNRGLLDQVSALEWIRDNIVAFGGDAERVTLFGQSAGGGCIAALLAMPTAAGLFSRAIVQSMPGTYFTPELAEDVTRAVAADAGVAVTQLADIPPWDLPTILDEVMATADRLANRWGLAAHRGVLVGPVVDGEVLPADPWRALSGGASRDVDLIVGHVRDEHRLFALLDGTLGTVDDEQAAMALDRFAPDRDAVRRYRSAGAADDWFERVHSDWLFRMPTLHLAEAHTGPVHVYVLTWPAPAMGGALGACHGLDVPLVFGNLTTGQPAILFDDDLTVAETVSARVRGSWTAFAAAGEPGWPRYEPDQRLTQVFDAESAVVPYPEETSRQIWQSHTFAALPLRSGA